MKPLNTALATAATVVALSAATTAHAGGLGLMTTAGFHGETVYFYDAGNGMAQIKQNQNIVSPGLGFDLVLGDRDDRITGTFRGYWVRDAAQKNPADLTSTVSPENVVGAYRENPANIGVAEVGVQFGFFGSPDTIQAITTVNIGSGFLTTDHREFLTASVAAGATWTFAPTLQAHATIGYAARYRKGFNHGAQGVLGVRYLFGNT